MKDNYIKTMPYTRNFRLFRGFYTFLNINKQLEVMKRDEILEKM